MCAKTDLLQVGDEDFEERVLRSGKVTLVEFWASWCGPCKEVALHVETLAGEYAGQVIVARVDIDENRKLVKRLGISSVPTIVFFENGRKVDQIDGAVPMEVIEQRLKDVLWSEAPEEKLLDLKEAERMLEAGLITAEEYEATKTQILGDVES
jgi:thioredoxin 1